MWFTTELILSRELFQDLCSEALLCLRPWSLNNSSILSAKTPIVTSLSSWRKVPEYIIIYCYLILCISLQNLYIFLLDILFWTFLTFLRDRKSTRLNSSH